MVQKLNIETIKVLRVFKEKKITSIDKIHISNYTGVPFVVCGFFLIKLYITRM